MRNILLLIFFALSPIFATAASTSPLTEESQEIVTPEQIVDEQTDWKTPTEQYKTSFIRTLLLIFAIIFLVIIVIWVLRRMGGTKPMMSNHYKNIKILERRALSPQTILYQVEIGGRQVIISESKVQVSALTEFDTLDKGKEL